jgi:hypothetical protein
MGISSVFGVSGFYMIFQEKDPKGFAKPLGS